MQDPEYRKKYNCARIFIPKAKAGMQRILDEDCELLIEAETLLLQNPNNLDKQGLLNKVEVTLKIPLDKKLVKDFGNFELRIKINDGVFNINKDFI